MTVAITGGTGTLGSFLAYRLAREGKPLILLGRGPDFKGRAVHRIAAWGKLDSWKSIQFLDWNETAHRKAGDVSHLIHGAADTNLSPRGGKNQVEINLNLLDRALELCDRWEVPRLDFLSTAYVCGKMKGFVLEERHPFGLDFRNPYERSKWLCEERLFEKRIDLPPVRVIHRPSLILPPLSHAKGNTPRAFARLFEKLLFLSRKNRAGELSVEIPETARIGFVSLSAFAEDFLNLLEARMGERPCILHYSSIQAPAIHEWVTWLCDRVPNLRIDLKGTCPLGRRILGELEPYIGVDFSFSHSNLDQWLGGGAFSPLPISGDYFRGLLDRLIQSNGHHPRSENMRPCCDPV